MNPILSVIIPTYHRNDLLSLCLEKLAPGVQSLAPSMYEVIVTDDGSSQTAQTLISEKFPWARWVKGLQRGPAANRNNGSRHAKSEWLVFTDDDCLPDENWLIEYKEAIDGHMVYEGLTDVDRPKERFDEESPINLKGGNLWSCNFMIKNSFFTNLRGFDEAFPYPAMEDTDLFVRICRQEATVKFVPAAKIIHPWRRVQPFRMYKKRLASHIYFAKKHGQYGKFSFRYSRSKIFVSDIFTFTKEIIGFSFKGLSFYFEQVLFSFHMIFM